MSRFRRGLDPKELQRRRSERASRAAGQHVEPQQDAGADGQPQTELQQATATMRGAASGGAGQAVRHPPDVQAYIDRRRNDPKRRRIPTPGTSPAASDERPVEGEGDEREAEQPVKAAPEDAPDAAEREGNRRRAIGKKQRNTADH